MCQLKLNKIASVLATSVIIFVVTPAECQHSTVDDGIDLEREGCVNADESNF